VFSGRIDRKTFLICTAIYSPIYFGFRLGAPRFWPGEYLPLLFVALIVAPRLRDVGLSGWWGMSPFGAGFVLGAVDAVARRLQHVPRSAPKDPIYQALMALIGLASLGFLIFLAVKKGRASSAEAVEAEAFS
jgi:uncharacterized membrane protein YhaH (DUF805 family)